MFDKKYTKKDLRIARELGIEDAITYLMMEKSEMAKTIVKELKHGNVMPDGEEITVNLANELSQKHKEGKVLGYVNKLIKNGSPKQDKSNGFRAEMS